jgi:hypothetical protein
MAAGSFANLTLTVKKASAVAANDVVVAFIDEYNRAKYYRPDLMALAPQAGDNPNVWLPSVTSITAIQDPTGASQTGQYDVRMKPGTSDTVDAASVLNVKVDANALFIVANSGTW